MRKIRIYLLCFLLGAALYPIIELLFRGRTHISMSILGGICLCSIYFVHHALEKGPLLLKALLSAILITQLEFICGVIVNLALGLAVWDYSALPLNLLGQISPRFSFYWFLLSLVPLLSFEKESKQRKLQAK
ncbi:MAG: hypothetical protein E7580_04815 [Ruminococcaceae bacterium]|nr:hypothetical protein [Oscillospiraceae bacterium]